MGDIAAVAERLRLVRKARRKFLRLWEIEQNLINPLLERVAEDLAERGAASQPEASSTETTAPDKHPDAAPVDDP